MQQAVSPEHSRPPVGGFLDPTQARVSQTGAVGYLGKLYGQGALLEAIGRAIGEGTSG
jgi:hypothetical protein